jgi:predicted AlkP superfamily pyrophosphatase or phosphodiesterase
MKKMKFLAAMAAIFFVAIAVSVAARPYVLLISIDGARWDYISREKTPNLWQFAEEGVRASSLKSVFPSSTFPNHISMITGMYPENHGIIANNFRNSFTEEEFSLRDRKAVKDGRWYNAETFWQYAGRWGIRTASFHFPGSDIYPEYRRPDYVVEFSLNIPFINGVNQVVKWFSLPEEKRPRFVTLYHDMIDHHGHEYGPGSSELGLQLRKVDTTFGLLLRGLELKDMLDSVNIIVASDHGMATVDPDQVVDFEPMLEGIAYEMLGYGPYAHFYAADSTIDEIYAVLKKNEQNYRIYRREDMPPGFHYSASPNIAPLVAVAEPGWLLVDGMQKSRLTLKGVHGYEPHWKPMQGIFLADGPDLKKSCKAGTLRIVDVFPLLCIMFDIPVPANIDGQPGEIEFILDN